MLGSEGRLLLQLLDNSAMEDFQLPIKWVWVGLLGLFCRMAAPPLAHVSILLQVWHGMLMHACSNSCSIRRACSLHPHR